MQKHNMLFSIDADVALAFRNQVPERQRSKVVSDLLSRFITLQEPDQDEQELIETIEECNRRREKIVAEQGAAVAMLARIKADKERKQKEHEERHRERFKMAVQIQKATQGM